MKLTMKIVKSKEQIAPGQVEYLFLPSRLKEIGDAKKSIFKNMSQYVCFLAVLLFILNIIKKDTYPHEC